MVAIGVKMNSHKLEPDFNIKDIIAQFPECVDLMKSSTG